MVELSEEDREELERLRSEFGEFEPTDRQPLSGEFETINPMLAETLDVSLEALDETEWYAEPKYDGTRIILQKFGGEIRAYTRRHVDRFDDIPTIQQNLESLPDDIVLDGELTFVTSTGVSSFQPVHTNPAELERRELTPVYYVFDVLFDSEDLLEVPLTERKERLEDIVDEGDHLSVTPVRKRDFSGYFDDLTDEGEEGLILKRRESHYYPGVRSEQWLKVKRFTERDAIVVGHTEGTGSREDTFGSLVLSDGEQCIGRVGTGFTEAELEDIADDMTETNEKRFTDDQAGKAYTPVEPFVITVKYQERTPDDKLRSPVYIRRNPEKPKSDVEPL